MARTKKILMPKGALMQKAQWSGTRGSYLTHIPEIEVKTIEEIEVTPIREPYAYGRVIYDHDKSEYLYEVWEPQLDDKEQKLLSLLKDSLNRTLEYEWDKMAEKDKEEYLKEAVESFIKSRGLRLEPSSRDKVVYYLIRDFVGYGPIDAFMADPRVEDVSCDGTNIPLFVFHQKFESIKTGVIFPDEDALNSFVVALGQRCGKQLSVANPILDGTSHEGHRIQATYSKEVTTRGSSFTIRRFKEKPFTPVELIKFNTASPDMVAYIWIAIEHGKSMMVCGGTASGKTATLNSAGLFIRPGAKIVSIEDTREINLPHENWIPGTTRSGVGERRADGKQGGEIDMYDLVRAALRQRPNYIIVGEVRGKETYTMFQAMATGHPTMSTMHAADPAHRPELRRHPDPRPHRGLDRPPDQAGRRARRVRAGDERADHEHRVRVGPRDGLLPVQGALVPVRRDHGDEEHDPRGDGGGVPASGRHHQLHAGEGHDRLPRDREDRDLVLPVPGRDREEDPGRDGLGPRGREARGGRGG